MDRMKEFAFRGKREKELREQQQRDLEMQRRLAEQRADTEERQAREARERAEEERRHRRAIELENARLKLEQDQRHAELEDQMRRRFEAEQQMRAAQEEERLRRQDIEAQKIKRRNAELQMIAMQEAEARRRQDEATRAAQIQQEQEERARRDRRIAQQKQEEENRRQERLRNTSVESLYHLRDLIRQKYQLDIKVWGMRGVMRSDQKIAVALGRESDMIMQQIRDTLGLWEEAAFQGDPKEWMLACQIRDGIQRSNPRTWENNPPWNDEPEKDEDDYVFF